MTTYIIDAEWKVKEGADIVLDAQQLHCIVLKEFRRDNIISFADSDKASNSINAFKPWLDQQEDITLVGHNILNADLEVFRNLLDIPFTVSL